MPTTDSHEAATCIGVGVYRDALTYGERYVVLAHEPAKQQVKVRGDNGRSRWFPEYCFDLSGAPPIKLVRTRIDDPLDEGLNTVDVVLEFSDGQSRWCFFTTPALLSRRGGDLLVDDERLLSYRCPHMIVVSAITAVTIERSLAYIESQGELIECTKLIE